MTTDSTSNSIDLSIPYSASKEAFERYYLTKALEATGGNVSQAARLIKTDRRTISRFLKKRGLSTVRTGTPVVSADVAAPVMLTVRAANEAFMREYLTKLLEATGGNVSRAAQLVGMHRRTIQRVGQRLGLLRGRTPAKNAPTAQTVVGSAVEGDHVTGGG